MDISLETQETNKKCYLHVQLNTTTQNTDTGESHVSITILETIFAFLISLLLFYCHVPEAVCGNKYHQPEDGGDKVKQAWSKDTPNEQMIPLHERTST